MMTGHRARPIRRLLAAAGAVLAIAGVVVIVIAALAQHHAPQPPASAAVPAAVIPATSPAPASTLAGTGRSTVRATPHPTPTPAPAAGTARATPHPTPTPAPASRGPVLPRSVPVALDIPALHVNTTLLQLGLNVDGTVQTPPLSDVRQAGWYKYSPTPGQLGPSVILGHIDSAQDGIGVFFYLGNLRQRDIIDVTLADHTVAVFEVTRVVEYKKTDFPTYAVYGNTDHAALRLITCGGTFNPAERSYESNIVAYAALVSAHPA